MMRTLRNAGGRVRALGLPLGSGLLAFWRLDEASGQPRLDRSAFGLTLTNNGTVGSGVGQIGNCATFSGSLLNYLSMAAPVIVGGPFSVSLWANLLAPLDATYPMTLWAQRTDLFDKQYIIATQSDQWAVNDGGGEVLADEVFAEQWTHVVCTSGTTLRVYVDAALVLTAPSARDFSGLTQMRIGGGEDPTEGAIDLVGIWARELSQADVRRLYRASSGFDPTA